MSELMLTSEIRCDLVEAVGSDLSVVRRWRPDATPQRLARLLGTFFRERHHSPLELGGWASFDVHAPLFVVRQIERHRWLSQAADDSPGLSFAEDSGRYHEMRPVFWVPLPLRPRFPADPFDPMRPSYRIATPEERLLCDVELQKSYESAWGNYCDLLRQGVAREVARAVLPLAVYAGLSMAGNLRAWLAFLALRTKDPAAAVVSYVQAECEEVGRAVEAAVRGRWPLVYSAWVENGRQSP